MKIDKVILTTDENPLYLDFWEPVSYVWKEIFKIEPVLGFYGNNDVPISEKYGKVVRLPLIENKKVGVPEIARLYLPTLFPDDICIVSDIDMLPMSKNLFFKRIEKVQDNDTLICLHSNPYGAYKFLNRVAMCYVIGKGSLFTQYFCDNNNFKDFINGLGRLHHGTDEQFLSKRIFKQVSKERALPFYFLDSYYPIERMGRKSNINIQDKKLFEHFDWHMPRPYGEYKDKIDNVIERMKQYYDKY